ncbi:MAG TPA: sugar phosphate nucleotidyltransferase [Candidatus Saccharimonadales bacterium]|nr:sugar phosphate nucleotidyltransferase [Candidatus Saccharimonadales bacterium]
MPQNNDLKIALFCGGTGTRMWPASRIDKPKQFQKLVGKETMFQQALKRITKGFPIKDVFVITGRNYVGLVIEQAPDLPLENIIIEPEMRDTLAAVGYAAAVLDKKFDNPIVASLWAADHLVKNEDNFIESLKAAFDYVKETGKIVSIDVRPTYANPHVGYIQIGKMIKKMDGMAFFEYVKQIEKPSLTTAKKLISSWEYLWHAGYKVWETKKMLALYKKHTPKVYDGLMKIHKAWGEDNQDDVVREIYPKFEKIMLDFAILEKIDPNEIVVLPSDLGWSDIGAWNILKDELADDPDDNVTSGEVVDVDSKDCLIYSTSPDKVVATIGLSHLIVVDTPDGLLVCQKDRVQDLKKVIEKLKEAKKEKYL